MRVGLIGPMSGLPDDNYPAFHDATGALRRAGYSVYSPAEIPRTPEDREMSLRMGADYRKTPEYAALLERTTERLLGCDVAATLPDWATSGGAIREVNAMEGAGIRVEPVEHWLARPVKPPIMLFTGDIDCWPSKAYPGDAGYDLYVAERTVVPYGSFKDIPLGISVELPFGVWAMLTGRSSTIRTRRLLVVQGILDNGFRGPLFAAVQNMDEQAVTVERGERIAQLIPFGLIDLHIEQADSLGVSDRGKSAFGSTGR